MDSSSYLQNHISFKHNKDMSLLYLIHPVLFFIVADMNMWAYKHGLPFKVTRTIDEKIEGVSVSSTHEEGRAIDVSITGWSTDTIDDFMYYFNGKYSEKYGAFSYSDGKPRLIPPIDHGTAPHFHVQIRRDIEIDN